MKKITILCTSLLIALNVTGCGDTSETAPETLLQAPTANDSETTLPEETATTETIIDAFENVYYQVSPMEYYPNSISVKMVTNDSPFNKQIKYDLNIESTETDKITVKATVNLEETSNFLEENAYKIEETEKIFEIPITEAYSYFVSEELFDMNKEVILSNIEQCLNNEIKYKNDLYSPIDFESNNQENQIEATPALSTDFEIYKIYISIPKEDTDFKGEQKNDSYSNEVTMSNYGISTDYNVFVIYENADNKFYLAYAGTPQFENGVIENYTTYLTLEYSVPDSWDSTLEFPDENAVYEEIEKNVQTDDYIIIKEVPIS